MNNQNWAGMNGADAWQLIWRIADGHTETSKMMEAWAEANRPAWISVKDRLPEDGQRVNFVVSSDSGERNLHLHGKTLGGEYCAHTRNFFTPGVGFIATHWQPMPEPPL